MLGSHRVTDYALLDPGIGVGVTGEAISSLFLPTTIDNLSLWLDASDTSTIALADATHVSQWTDKSSNAHAFTQGVTANQPQSTLVTKNSLNTIDWGGNDEFVGPEIDFYAAGLTVFVVCKADTDSIDQMLLSQHDSSTNGTFFCAIRSTGNVQFTTITTTRVDHTETPNEPLTGWNIFSFRYNGTDQIIRQNGIQLGAAVAHTGALKDADALSNVGDFDFVGLDWLFNGQHGEILAYRAGLTDSEMEQAEDYLSKKWDIGLNRPMQLSSGLDWSLVILPDTQFYSQDYPVTFTDQTDWIVSNQSKYKIGAVLHVGDVVDDDVSGQWDNGVAGMATLATNNIPHLISVGNHDYDNMSGSPPVRSDVTEFNTRFPQSRYTSETWWNGGFYEGGRSENAYYTARLGGKDYLFMTLEYGPRDAVLSWAAGIIDTYPNHLTVIATHAYMYTDDTRHGDSGHLYLPENEFDTGSESTTINNGRQIYNKILLTRENVKMVHGGHVLSPGVGSLDDTRDGGNVVHQYLANYQDRAEGGEGYLRIYQMMRSVGEIRVYTYSPTEDAYLVTAAQRFTSATSYDIGSIANQVSMETDKNGTFDPTFVLSSGTANAYFEDGEIQTNNSPSKVLDGSSQTVVVEFPTAASVTDFNAPDQGLTALPDLTALTSLEEIRLHTNASMTGDISVLSALTSLTYMHFGGSGVSGDGQDIGTLTGLSIVYINATSVSADISEWTSLTAIYVINTSTNTNVSYGTGGAAGLWVDATQMRFHGCSWTTTEVDQVCDDIWAARDNYNNAITLSLEGSNASPSAAQQANLETLKLPPYSWTITYNV